MGVKADRWIIEQCETTKMIEPFVTHAVRTAKGRRVISYGPSAYGYDIRCAPVFKVPSLRVPPRGSQTGNPFMTLNPKAILEDDYVEMHPQCVVDGVYAFEIDPNSCVLTHSVEYFRIPRGVLGICFGKSTYARCGLVVNVTPLEPEWEGHLVIEISNTSDVPVYIYPGEGIAQLVFLGADEDCAVSYKDKGGKYQGQRHVQVSTV